MKQKKFKHKNKKKLVQLGLTAVPMTEAELPGMPKAPPKPPEARISEARQFAISECAIDCANDPKALEIFLEEMAEAMYYAKRKPLSIIMISHQNDGINCSLTLLPEASTNIPLDPTHALALEAFRKLAVTPKQRGE